MALAPGDLRLPARALALATLLVLAAWGAARAAEVQVHGLLDVVAAERGEAYEYNVLTRGDAAFDAYGLRLFANAQVSPKLQIFTQFVFRDAVNPYVDGAYVLFTPIQARDAHVLAGKIPWPLGTWAPRTYSNRNPLIGTPLMYQYHTTLVWYDVPPNADALLATAGGGQAGVNYFGYPEGRGMALVDDSYWDVGVTVVGSERPFEYALGMTAGTPGWGSTGQDENAGKSVLGRVGIAPLPSLRLGVSGAYGPYLDQVVRYQLPVGSAVEDYHQKLLMADFELQAGHAELRAEGAHNTWETPYVGDLHVHGGYVEIKYSLPVGAFVAGRWDALRFGSIADSTGARHPWDRNVTRIEGGAGYRFSRDAVAKLIYQRTSMSMDNAPAIRPGMVAAQVSVSF